LFPVLLDDLVPGNNIGRVIDAIREWAENDGAWFRASGAADTDRPGYDPRDLLKLYL
jgi:hypothetical protein